MKKTVVTGQTCVGELRLSRSDVGHDLRATKIPIDLACEFRSVGLDQDGETWLIEGTRSEMIDAIVNAGYAVKRLFRVPTAGPEFAMAVTNVRCPVCRAGTVRWAEAGHVPFYRECDHCGRHFMGEGDSDNPRLTWVD